MAATPYGLLRGPRADRAMIESDYILRMIQQLAKAIARIVGLKQAGQLDEALDELRTTADGIFGPIRHTLDAIDARSAAGLLANREKIEAYAAVTAEEASILEQMGDASSARSGEQRAISLYLEALMLSGTVSGDARTAIVELCRRVDEETLPARYRELIASLDV
jgi:hypothetical protein